MKVGENVSIRHLKIFVIVAKLESMSRAANELYLTQPTISQAIKELEEYYECRLFDRLPKRLSLTDAGCKLLE